jgi:hypothetical protein
MSMTGSIKIGVQHKKVKETGSPFDTTPTSLMVSAKTAIADNGSANALSTGHMSMLQGSSSRSRLQK